MTGSFSPNPPQLNDTEAQDLLLKLRQKQGSWVDWGKMCQTLQKSGYDASVIFEETGIEASYQNLMIVAVQVYDSLVKENASEDLLTYCQGPRSDVLYEFRILNQQQRLLAVQLAQEKRLDVDQARLVAKAIQTFFRYAQLPQGFTAHPGDAVAYQSWKQARSKKDLQERSRLIAQGLKYAHSATARSQLEQLLSDFTVVAPKRAPLLPLYRLEAEEELPRIVPIAGQLPLTTTQVEAVPSLEEIEPFRIIQATPNTQYLPLPGWQMVLKAQDPVAILTQSNKLPNLANNSIESVVILIDRKQKDWNDQSYFLVEKNEELAVQWLAEEPNLKIVGQVVLILRPKKILDENNIIEPWQMDD